MHAFTFGGKNASIWPSGNAGVGRSPLCNLHDTKEPRGNIDGILTDMLLRVETEHKFWGKEVGHGTQVNCL